MLTQAATYIVKQFQRLFPRGVKSAMIIFGSSSGRLVPTQVALQVVDRQLGVFEMLNFVQIPT